MWLCVFFSHYFGDDSQFRLMSASFMWKTLHEKILSYKMFIGYDCSWSNITCEKTLVEIKVSLFSGKGELVFELLYEGTM